jgi:23S rRNA pseudouridine1911/1915/1917 synthase
MPSKYLDILREDDQLVFLNKPPGLLSIPDRYDPAIVNLYALLKARYGHIFTLHRLDKDTSGLMVFAKTAEAHKELSQQFEHRKISKTYWAVVDGTPPESGKIDVPVQWAANQHRMVVRSSGKSAFTEYSRLETFGLYSLLKVQIHTGRTHQIRIHLQSIGHPLAIDPIYGSRNALFLSRIKRGKYYLKKGQEEQPLIDRCTLHARTLSLKHPKSGSKILVEAPIPKDLKALLNQLRKWS